MSFLLDNWFFVVVLLLCVGMHFFGHGHGHGGGHSHGGGDRSPDAESDARHHDHANVPR